MKLTVVPPVPPPTYVLELTRAEIVRLGKLSYAHEPAGPSYTKTFFRCLPSDVQKEVEFVRELRWEDAPWEQT